MRRARGTQTTAVDRSSSRRPPGLLRPLHVLTFVLLLAPPQRVAGQAGQEDILEILMARPGLAERLGIDKLTPEEREAWNEVLNAMLSAGRQMSASGEGLPGPGVGDVGDVGVAVFESTVEAADGSIIRLSNGAVVEVSGYLGYVGPPGRGLLVRQGRSWRLWIEGREALTVRLISEPERGGRAGELVSVSEILGDGAILRLTDGRTLEVGTIDRVSSGIWLPFFNAILIGGYELLNLDKGEKVSVRVIG